MVIRLKQPRFSSMPKEELKAIKKKEKEDYKAYCRQVVGNYLKNY